MSRVIEIYDSDDESTKNPANNEATETEGVAVPTSDAEGFTPTPTENNIAAPAVDAPGSRSPPPLIISEVTSINTSPISANTVAVTDSQTATSTTASTASTVTATNAGTTQQTTKRRRRKSMHHPLCASPEIEFETIALDDDEDNAPTKTKIKHTTSTNANTDGGGAQEDKSPKSQKTAPKILNSKTSAASTSNSASSSKSASIETEFNKACKEFLESDETNALLRKIAENRVRINFLLASYNMPEIQFSLYSQSEVLQFQLDERVKSRRSRFIEQAKQLKKRRELYQNSTGRTSTS